MLRRVAALLLLPMFLLMTVQARAAVVDDRGARIALAKPPQRIVTLLPSLTETVCELGACERLVGVDDYSNWPAQVARLPHVGGVDDASIERIVALKPDLVLLSSSSRALQRLESLGVKVMGLDLKTFDDVRRALLRVSQVVGAGDAEAIWKRMNARIDAAAAALPANARGTTVYYEVSGGGYAASASSHVGAVLARLGAVNVVPGELGTVPKLNPEFVVRADPQLVMASRREIDELAARPGWHRIRAIRDKRVCTFAPAEGDVLARPGPRMGEAAEILARCLATPFSAAGRGPGWGQGAAPRRPAP
ncbi:ABC transporter substrate-binding protein [Ramlibacter sp.]|uniref:ABC transporter substrate-binding protein n=1 Tax=Ramlibacter sp. TaxID=1917967 RepID=UPI003D096FB7